MKQIIFSILAVGFWATSSAQTVYESPCVVDGKTFQLTIPEGFYQTNDLFSMRTMYTTVSDLDYNMGSDDMKGLALAMLTIAYQDNGEYSLSWYAEEMRKGLSQLGSEIEVVNSPEIIGINDRDVLFSAAKGSIDGMDINALYFGFFLFGERIAMINYTATKTENKFISFEDFQDIFFSLKEIETGKMDVGEQSLEEELQRYMDEKINGLDADSDQGENDLFLTNISSSDIAQLEDEDWVLSKENNGHFLEEYVYKSENGRVQVFSGGNAESYSDLEAMEEAIQLVLELEEKPKMELYASVLTENYTYKNYSISGAKRIKYVYVSEIEGELVFFLLNEGRSPSPDFESAAQELIRSFGFYEERSRREEMPSRQE